MFALTRHFVRQYRPLCQPMNPSSSILFQEEQQQNRRNKTTKTKEARSAYMEAKRKPDAHKSISKTQEFRQRTYFETYLKEEECYLAPSPHSLSSVGLDSDGLKLILEAGLATFHLHCEARFAASVGKGYYTIGPCGEELLSAIGVALNTTDATALHYRHLATQISKSLRNGVSLDEIILNRARASCISTQDPVAGGAHCALGGGPVDYYVTSTLSSQAPQAFGRALGLRTGSQLCSTFRLPCTLGKNSINYVSVGDGSVNNAHFLSSLNMAQYAEFRGFKCPLVFAISDNNLSISLPGYGWLNQFLQQTSLPLFTADGNDVLDVFNESNQAVQYARENKAPCILQIKNLVRRFGHAATDRQEQYLTQSIIATNEGYNPLYGACALAVHEGVATYKEILSLFRTIQDKVERAFEVASEEEKLTERAPLVKRNKIEEVPQSGVMRERALAEKGDSKKSVPQKPATKLKKGWMRKHMTQVIHETMASFPDTVYIGEDVQHGGYYLVTEGLYAKHPFRVRDFPPDEGSIIGSGMGFAQVGLVPIVEIPYAKYLDCGYDQFTEAAIMHWLTNGKFTNGMIIRLQGFGPGLFGGNYHTHNSLHLLPGLDVVCYSNGADYARGFRNAYHQAKKGRVVVSVDCTQLLNMRNVHETGDDMWMTEYPPFEETIPFDFVRNYGEGKKLALVTYGTGVITALTAQKELKEKHDIDSTVIDSPYLSDLVPSLEKEIGAFDNVLFVDICKVGQHPFSNIALQARKKGLLKNKGWDVIGAEPTYNPLGQLTTFISKEDIIDASLSL